MRSYPADYEIRRVPLELLAELQELTCETSVGITYGSRLPNCVVRLLKAHATPHEVREHHGC